MKKFYLVFGFTFILLFLKISNIKAIDVDSYIEVDSLPTCDSTTANNIYALSIDNHYHKCNFIPGDLRNIIVGDDLSNKIIYIDIPDTFVVNSRYPIINDYNAGSVIQIYIITQYLTSGNYQVFAGGRVITQLYWRHKTTGVKQYDVKEFNANDTNSDDYMVYSINTSSPLYQYIKISADDTYIYEDLGEITEHIYFTHIDKDFYLFYDFGTISTFNIFSSYDFTTFTDFQRLVIVIGVNTFYLGFLGLCIYILVKLIYKLISWII